MHFHPECLRFHRRPKPRISILLIDWGVRESFHSLHYLNHQTVDRDAYELIWIEFYDHKPPELARMADRGDRRSPFLDKWMVLGYPADYIFHKHRLYNIGILLAEADICVICDSDAIFRPTFIETLLRAYAETPTAVIHLDEVRNVRQDLYPFQYPEIDELLGPGCINWRGSTTLGLDSSPDRLHHANYGACMAARRKDLLAIGGADEDLDFLGYICGPYDLTFRLLNYGRIERWMRDEYLYHTWHPNQYGFNTDYQGPHDGFHLSLLALETRATFRVGPTVKNPWLARLRGNSGPDVEQFLRLIGERAEPAWRAGAQPSQPGERVYWIERDWYGFDIFHYAGTWYALPTGSGRLQPEKLRRHAYAEIWQAPTKPEIHERLAIDRQRWEKLMNNVWSPARLWRKVRAQPLHRLPGRIVRSARRLIT